MYATTGLTCEQFHELVHRLRCEHPQLLRKGRHRAPHRLLTFERKVHLTVCYLRLNVTEAVLAEFFDTSQSTASRVIRDVTPLIQRILEEYVPTADDLDPNEQLIIDGSLLPCWSWHDHPELWSGKHKKTGVNVQVAADHAGHLVWVSDPEPGKTHDAHAIRNSGVLETLPADSSFAYIGDKGYVGLGMLTPRKKPAGGDLTDQQKANNRSINSVRAAVERTIANLKTWRVLFTDYRRPYETFPETIAAVLGLEFYRTC